MLVIASTSALNDKAFSERKEINKLHALDLFIMCSRPAFRMVRNALRLPRFNPWSFREGPLCSLFKFGWGLEFQKAKGDA